MTGSTYKDLEKFESDLWEAADNLRANSKLTSSDYFMPVLGVIFLRHAANRFEVAQRQIEADQASGKMPKRKEQRDHHEIRRRNGPCCGVALQKRVPDRAPSLLQRSPSRSGTPSSSAAWAMKVSESACVAGP